MQFSLIFQCQASPTTVEIERDLLSAGVEMAVLAEAVGFDRFYVTEHHGLVGYSHNSAPEVLLSYIAARTTRIRLAHGVMCLPFNMNHPVRAAERAATLDVLSGGRLDLGVGRSSSRWEHDLFSIVPEDTEGQLVESLRAMVGMWTQDLYEHHSPTLDLPPRQIRPKPLQDPHPPLSMACVRDASVQLAGRLGVGAMINAVDGIGQTAHKRALYDAAFDARDPSEAVGKVDNRHFGSAVFTTVLDDGDEARRIGLRGMRYFLESSRYFFGGVGDHPDPSTWSDDDTVDALMQLTRHGPAPERGVGGTSGAVGLGSSPWHIDFTDPDAIPFGTADHTANFVEGMAAAGADECIFVVQMGGIPIDVVMETIRQIGTNIIPRFRRPSAVAGVARASP